MILSIEPVFMALSASVFYSITLIFFRRGLEYGSPFVAILFINAFVCIAGFFFSSLTEHIPQISLNALFWFIVTGIVGFGIGHLIAFIGIQKIGVNRSAPITSVTPIWSVLFAVLFLNEKPNFYVCFGTFLIAAGVWILSIKSKVEEVANEDIKSGLICSLSASILFSIMPVFLKYAYSDQATPFFGMSVAFGTGAIAVCLTRPFLPKDVNRKTEKLGFQFFAIAAFFNVFASIFMWHSMHKGDISVIIPVSRLNTLWVLILSFFFLKKVETLSLRIVIGALIVLIGGMLVIVYRF
ncbi:MAG: GRP family sugar transporter [Nitrospinota bacterium]|nr:GRP family sugar transporter [Nitrospinota bacterium]